jgi:hypothetical protein
VSFTNGINVQPSGRLDARVRALPFRNTGAHKRSAISHRDIRSKPISTDVGPCIMCTLMRPIQLRWQVPAPLAHIGGYSGQVFHSLSRNARNHLYVCGLPSCRTQSGALMKLPTSTHISVGSYPSARIILPVAEPEHLAYSRRSRHLYARECAQTAAAVAASINHAYMEGIL